METTLIGRLPILDKNGEIYAYELIFRDEKRKSVQSLSSRHVTARVVSDIFNTFGIEKVIDNKRALLNVDEAVLYDESLEWIPPHHIIFDLNKTIPVDDRTIERVTELKAKGYAFAIDEMDLKEGEIERFLPLFDLIEIIRINLRHVKDPKAIKEKMRFFAKFKLTFLAENVESVAMFEKYKALGFSYFQGHFFARPDVVKSKKLEANYAAVIKLINKLNSDTATKGEIESDISHDPTLAVSLLKYINSPLFPTRKEISSISQAANLLGRNPLLHWLTLTLYSSSKNIRFKDTIIESVMLRAEMMATFGKKLKMSNEKVEIAYLVGLLSMLGALLNMSDDDIFKEIAFDTEVKQAVLKKEGALGNLLKLVILVEKGAYTRTLGIVKKLGIGEKELAQILSSCYATVMNRK